MDKDNLKTLKYILLCLFAAAALVVLIGGVFYFVGMLFSTELSFKNDTQEAIKIGIVWAKPSNRFGRVIYENEPTIINPGEEKGILKPDDCYFSNVVYQILNDKKVYYCITGEYVKLDNNSMAYQLSGKISLPTDSLEKMFEACVLYRKNNPTNKPEETVTPSEQPQQTQMQNPEIVFADKLSSCTAYKTTFKHPLTGDMLEKEILGIVNGKCDYIEQMPNGGKMECKYSESERMAVAQYYKDVATAESVGTSVHVDSEGQQTKYIINGKEVANPLPEAMNSGICVISGY